MFANLDSPSMHFAVGMFCVFLLSLPVLLVRPQWWPYVPIAQTFGGIFALAPDWILVLGFYPNLPFSRSVDLLEVKQMLHGDIGNLFFFHTAMDGTGEGNFLRGFILTTLQYNLWIVLSAIAHWWRRRRRHQREFRHPSPPHRRRTSET